MKYYENCLLLCSACGDPCFKSSQECRPFKYDTRERHFCNECKIAYDKGNPINKYIGWLLENDQKRKDLKAAPKEIFFVDKGKEYTWSFDLRDNSQCRKCCGILKWDAHNPKDFGMEYWAAYCNCKENNFWMMRIGSYKIDV